MLILIVCVCVCVCVCVRPLVKGLLLDIIMYFTTEKSKTNTAICLDYCSAYPAFVSVCDFLCIINNVVFINSCL